ncbi:putative protein-serine/threonine phosphatase [Rosa chinensis]|uniref:Calcineurin-like phosphoesterase domain-containing protein n=1 Tax=Rosa chinensis TaxID=74649 RepID=A0A2P6SDY9_ROSCH|nr:putative protein-serine/threonine phosphatase [Rosa chinensis]
MPPRREAQPGLGPEAHVHLRLVFKKSNTNPIPGGSSRPGFRFLGSLRLQDSPQITNCVKIDDCGPDSTVVVVVVGDVHGQLHDVLFLLKDAGYPSENRVFVFNGDYVDRGAWGLETFLILLAWKVLMPKWKPGGREGEGERGRGGGGRVVLEEKYS